MSSKLKILHSKITSDKGEELLILHGFLGMGDNWKTYANVLTKMGYRVHLIDQRNHGKSFWSEEFSYSVMAEDILNYCKFHKLGQIFILGHSMGGKVAMELAFNHSYLLKAFIIADISPRKYEPKHEQILNGLSCLDFNKINSRAFKLETDNFHKIKEEFNKCSFFIGVDTGLSHICAGLGLSGIFLFGPTDPSKVGPVFDHQRVIKKSRMTEINPYQIIEMLKEESFD